MPDKRKILAAAALTASLTAGGVVGAMFGTPALSSAQTAPDQTTERAERPAQDGESRAAHRRHEGGPGHDGRPGHPGRRLALEAAADALGMTPEELKAELRAGKSVRTVAEERDIEVQTVIEAIVAAVTEHAEERATEFVNRERPADAAERANRRQ